MVTTKSKRKSKVWEVELRQDWCKGCYFCIDTCPIEDIFTKTEEIGSKGFQLIVVKAECCTGCMLCELLCPDLAITVTEGGEK